MNKTDQALKAALRWTSAALQAQKREQDIVTIDGESKSVSEILDDADAALAAIQPAEQPEAAQDERDALTQAPQERAAVMPWYERKANDRATLHPVTAHMQAEIDELRALLSLAQSSEGEKP